MAGGDTTQNPLVDHATEGSSHDDNTESEFFGGVVNKHISSGWIDSHTVSYNTKLPRLPLCRLFLNPVIRTHDDHIMELQQSIAHKGYQPSMARFIVSECIPGEDHKKFDRRGHSARDCAMSYDLDEELRGIPELAHMVERYFVVWDGNHHLEAWKRWMAEEDIPIEEAPRVECVLIDFSASDQAEFLLVLGIIDK